MPTTRPRHQVTETPALAAALDLAAEQWPHEPRSKLLGRLVHAGAAVLASERRDTARVLRRAVESTSGKYSEAFGADYLSELREDWPE